MTPQQHSRILIWGDPHFRRDNVDNMQAICDFIEQTIDQYQPDLFICLGDVMDTHERCYMTPYVQAHNFFDRVSQKVKTVTLVGNHDRENNTDFMSDKHFLRGLAGHVVDYAQVDSFDPRIMYVPYVPPGRFNEAIKDVWHPGVKICFAHQEFRGAADNMYVSDIEEEADPRMLIISGHYHKFQRVGDTLIYAGTIQHRYGDCPDNALLMVDLDTMDISRIPVDCIKKKITAEFSVSELDSIEPYLDQHQHYYDIRVNITVPYGYQINHNDPRIRAISGKAASIVFHRIQLSADDTNDQSASSAPNSIELPSFKDVLRTVLSDKDKSILKQHKIMN